MKPVHIFRTGTHTDISGREVAFSAADLAAIAAGYDPAVHEAPLVIGHPKTDDPAFGWVQGLRVGADGGLEAEVHQVDPAFAEVVDAGRYKKISPSFYSPTSPRNPKPGAYYLRHVGFLGAEPPAVKGLRPVEFAETEADSDVLEFSEAVPPPAPPAPSPEPPTTSPVKETTVTPEEAARLEAENKTLQERLKAMTADVAAKEAALRHDVNLAFAEGLTREAKLAPKHRDVVVAVLDHLATPAGDGETLSFGEGNDKKPMAEALKSFLSDQPEIVALRDTATKDRAAGGADDEVSYAEGTDPERIALDKRIRAYASEHKVTYAVAAARVAK
ncbi:MAG: peptidase [Alphaproteobacteria bacterium]|jgi:hypothetical protein|nr:peptidase [Alphaproteobacteria bacterium]